MILGRKLRIQEAQAVVTAAATLAEGTQVGATPEAVVATLEAATRVVATLEEGTQVGATPEEVVATLEGATRVVATLEEGTPAVEDPEGDKMMAGGIPRMTKGSKS